MNQLPSHQQMRRGRAPAPALGAVLLLSIVAAALGAPAGETAAKSSTMRPSFADFDQRARAGEPLSVVFLGGSLTWGANASDPQITSYRGRMVSYLRDRYPRVRFQFHDAAIGGTGSKLALFRLDRDVLSKSPDLVFLDFTVNDGIDWQDVSTLDSYETVLRELVSRGILVLQVRLGMKWNFGPAYAPERLHRYIAHQKLAEAYRTGVGDVLPVLQKKIEARELEIGQVWPWDEAHPDDVGYQMFFEAVRDGFEKAVREGRTGTVPEQPVFRNTYKARTRYRLTETLASLPAGWSRGKTFRTSLWFDGLSSRWMDDVVVCDTAAGKMIAPLRLEFQGTFVAVFGECDQDGLAFRVTVDGKPLTRNAKSHPVDADVWPANTKAHTKGGVGQLFFFQELSAELPPGRHVLEITPVLPTGTPAVGQLRIESICVAGE